MPAAKRGEVDAMNEVAWCYETGFGGAKDKASDLSFSCLLYRVASRTVLTCGGDAYFF